MIKIQNELLLKHLKFKIFGIVSGFEFWYSNLLLLIITCSLNLPG
jgi:hypothetical protein